MENLLDVLEKLIPTVIIIASFLLPAFLKKKNEEKKKAPRARRPAPQTRETAWSGEGDTATAEKNLEDQIRKYFSEVKASKSAQAAEARAKEPQVARAPAISPAPYPRPADPARLEPAAAPGRSFSEALAAAAAAEKRKPAVYLEGAPQETAALEAEPMRPLAEDDAYHSETEAYNEEDAYLIAEDVHEAAFEIGGGATAEIGALPAQAGDVVVGPAGERKLIAARAKRRGKRGAAAAEDWTGVPPLAAMGREGLRRAIILKEVLGPPVGLRPPVEEHLW